jgi:DnaJ-class molecular chaperone
MATVDPIKVEVEILHEWQLCPKCNGVGLIDPISSSHTVISTMSISCDLCNGKKIISKVTGEPPK